MDLWVVAAAAGAGYLAKYWQHLSKEGESLASFLGDSVSGESNSRPFLEHLSNKPCPFRMLGRRVLGEDVSSSKEGVLSSSEVSTSAFDDEPSVNYGICEEYNVLSFSSWPSGSSSKRDNQEIVDRNKGNNDDGLAELSRGEMGSCYGSVKRTNSLRSRRTHGYSVKPLSSLESCLIAQMYKEQHGEMDEYVFSSLPSPSTPTLRSMLATDGSRIIGRASSELYRLQFENGGTKLSKDDAFYSVEKGTVFGVPPLPEIGPMEFPKKPKQKRGMGRLGRSSSSNTKVSGILFPSQGSPDGMFLFCLGVTLGVISTAVASKKEVNKLHELLKQTENLVQDLQEELEMKDSLTVKELANEGYEYQETTHSFRNWAPTSYFSAQKLDESSQSDVKRPEDLQKSDENSDSMSKIEAELEAELERLELNMNASSLEGKLSGLVELDPDFVGDIVKGELRADMVNGGVDSQDDSDKNMSGTSTTQTQNANYAVSPRELSLRLHEVIRSRLEERVMELEIALQNSQNRVHLMEPKRMDFSNSKIGSSSRGSPTMIEEGNTMDRLLFPNLSEDSHDAFGEAYEEFMKVTGTSEEKPTFMAHKSNQINKEELHPLEHIFFCGRNEGEENGSLTHLKMVEERDSGSLVCDKVRKWKESVSMSWGLDKVGESEDDTDEGDEMGKLLIKQIVEKTRQGSPAVLNAQKVPKILEQFLKKTLE